MANPSDTVNADDAMNALRERANDCEVWHPRKTIAERLGICVGSAGRLLRELINDGRVSEIQGHGARAYCRIIDGVVLDEPAADPESQVAELVRRNDSLTKENAILQRSLQELLLRLHDALAAAKHRAVGAYSEMTAELARIEVEIRALTS